jgi:hypothetical protein
MTQTEELTEEKLSFDARTVLSTTEMSALKSAIQKRFSDDGLAVLTPRSIRSLLFNISIG